MGNRLLRNQLADNTLSFRKALETTHQYLLEGTPLSMASHGSTDSLPTEKSRMCGQGQEVMVSALAASFGEEKTDYH